MYKMEEPTQKQITEQFLRTQRQIRENLTTAIVYARKRKFEKAIDEIRIAKGERFTEFERYLGIEHIQAYGPLLGVLYREIDITLIRVNQLEEIAQEPETDVA